MSGEVRYVVGFALDETGRVALIRKNRPAWQSGLLNGIGGHVEEGEAPDDAMFREFWEETGAALSGWERFVEMEFPGAPITFYRLRVDEGALDSLRSETDEPVSIHWVADLPVLRVIPNLSWLVPLAAYTADHYQPIHVQAAMAEAAS